MTFGRILSLAVAIAAIVSLFVEIPIVSDFAFWFLVAALFVWFAVHPFSKKNRFRFWVMVAVVLLLVAIVGVFVAIPFVTDYSFWILVAAYFVAVGSTGSE
jgi:hypothetical protein